MVRLFFVVLQRDLLLAMRQLSDLFSALVFFLIVVSLFPLALGTDKQLLRDLAPAIVWVSALLSSTLSIGRIFGSDHSDGSLEQMLLANEPLPVAVLAKVIAHWSTTGFPIVLLAPLSGLLFDLDTPTTVALVIGLLIGTPIFSAVGAIGAALTLGVKGNSILATIVLLPLYVPVLIFGAGATHAGANVAAHMLLLAAGLSASLALGPWVTAASLRIAIE
ncbi:heme exporter protein CcmB [Noviherbaspirillum sp. CPCC 100848]|uniref:Heme exporter protein B n=1 Tax=Noviherbaspirillum album TaxID=3080276 RepID=A0ABU6JK86_9BURK|nr:heme exporter protein CcmB [Noviherbaspirillum sp. CPCC 100848]MEC4723642.1 heme exporter protein CcmB [Noviherbaspirillum sp. CPCC 100848]